MSIIGNITAPAEMPATRMRQILWRRRATFVGVLGAGVALSMAGYLSTPPRYAAEAVIALDARQLQGLPSQAVISALPQDNPVLRTELDLIRSRLLAAKVLDKLAAAGIVIDPYPRPSGPVETVKSRLRQVAAAVGLGGSTGAAPASAADRRRDSIGVLLNDLRVANDGRSLTIFIDYTANTPALAASIANAFAEAYIDHQVEVQTGAVDTVRDWLGQKVEGLRQQLEASENARAQFRQRAGILEVDGSTLQAHRVGELDQQLVTVRTELVGAQARLATAQAAAGDPDGAAFQEILASPTIQAFRIEQARLQRAIEDIDSSGATKSGELPLLKSQLGSIDAQIAGETQRVIASLANEVAVAERKEANLTQAMQAAQAALAKTSTALVQVAELDRVATANKELYDSYLTRYKQTVEQDGIASPEAQLISTAEPSPGKISPSLAFALLVGFGGGGTAALAAAFLRELTDKRIRSTTQLEEAAGTGVLGAIGSPTRGKGRKTRLAAFDRSIARLYASLRSSPAGRHARVITTTSARAGEGKTLVTVALARALAAADCRVLIIDLDLNSRAVTEAFPGRPTIHLDQALRDPQLVTIPGRFEDRDEIVVVACRAGHVPPELLIDDKHLGVWLAAVRDRFDVVLIDTPASSRSSLAMQAAGLSDLTLFVVNIAVTGVREAAAAVQELRAGGQPALALVTTDFVRPAPFPAGPGDEPNAHAGPIDTSEAALPDSAVARA